MRQNKYRAQPTEIDGIKFHSKGEAARYGYLRQLQRAGIIQDLKLQPSFKVIINGKLICTVKLDFQYTVQGKDVIYEDFKGYDNPMSKLKRKLVEAAHGIKVTLVTKQKTRVL